MRHFDKGAGCLSSGRNSWLKNLPWIVVGLVVIAFAFVPFLRENLIVATKLLMEADLPGLRKFILSFGVAAPLVSFLLMIFQAFASPIPSVLIFVVNSAIFGTWTGLILSWFSSLASAWVCFWLARRLGQPFVSQFVQEGFLAKIDRFFGEYGSMAVLFSRVLPFMPFDFASYAFGVTRVTWWDFTWGTALGQTPAIVFYTFLGYRVLTPAQYTLYFGLWILTLVVLTPLLGRYIKGRRALNAQNNDSMVPPNGPAD